MELPKCQGVRGQRIPLTQRAIDEQQSTILELRASQYAGDSDQVKKNATMRRILFLAFAYAAALMGAIARPVTSSKI